MMACGGVAPQGLQHLGWGHNKHLLDAKPAQTASAG